MTKYGVLLTRFESTKLDDGLRTVVKTRMQADFQN